MEENTKNKITFDSLDDDCLQNIFRFLPIKDKIRIERVCERWKKASIESWRYKTNIDSGDMRMVYEMTKNRKKKAQKEGKPIILHILERCGTYLTSLSFTFAMDLEVLKDIGELCPNMKIADFKRLSKAMIESMIAYCQDIEELTLCYLEKDCTEDLVSELLISCSKLKVLKCYEQKSFSGKFLLFLPAWSIKKICFECCSLSALWVDKAFKEYPRLKTLSIEYISRTPISTLPMALKELRFENIRDSELDAVLKLSQLKVLNISESFINDLFLEKLAKSCTNLSTLILKFNSNVTDDGLRVIQRLPKLTVLCLNQLERITDRGFVFSPLLEMLCIYYCHQVESDGLCKFIEACDTIERLRIFRCCNIEDSSKESFEKSAKLRKNNVPLDVQIVDRNTRAYRSDLFFGLW